MGNWLKKSGLVMSLEPDTEILKNLDVLSDIIKGFEGLSKQELFNKLREFKDKNPDITKRERIIKNTIYIGENRTICKRIGVEYLNNNVSLIIQTALYSLLDQ